jgi:hypothetical protein
MKNRKGLKLSPGEVKLRSRTIELTELYHAALADVRMADFRTEEVCKENARLRAEISKPNECD